VATNTLAPMGLVPSRHILGISPSFQANKYKIKAGYATKIGIGDVVVTGTGGNQGYVTLAPDAAQGCLGVFAGVLPYFDNTLQGNSFGTNGAWPGSNANAASDVDCLVYDDPFLVFRVQVNGGPWAITWRGDNATWTTTTNGAPNNAGISTLSLLASSIATTNTLPLRIQELVGVTGGPADPANTNPWVEVRLNLSEHLASTGI
jgi:hypothetical protein